MVFFLQRHDLSVVALCRLLCFVSEVCGRASKWPRRHQSALTIVFPAPGSFATQTAVPPSSRRPCRVSKGVSSICRSRPRDCLSLFPVAIESCWETARPRSFLGRVSCELEESSNNSLAFTTCDTIPGSCSFCQFSVCFMQCPYCKTLALLI